MCIAVLGNQSQSYRASPAIWYHAVLPGTWHRWTYPTLPPVRQTGRVLDLPILCENYSGHMFLNCQKSWFE